MTESLEALYRSSQALVRMTFGEDKVRALEYYASLVHFV
jgi:hypothetical protein